MILAEELMLAAPGHRHGVVMAPQVVPGEAADLDHIVSVAVPRLSSAPWQSAAGGVGRTEHAAILCAVGEALERYAASVAPLRTRPRHSIEPESRLDPEDFSLFDAAQRGMEDFPAHALYDRTCPYVEISSMSAGGRACWAPAALVGLRSDGGEGVSTSSGLAVGTSCAAATLRALQEVVERDALMITWQHGVAGRRVELDARYTEPVNARGGEVVCFDATPAHSAHPVALVAGSLPRRGVPRISLGAACRARWQDAVEKAYLEWVQGTFFAGVYQDSNPSVRFRTSLDVVTFDDHAAYFSTHPERWAAVPLLRGTEHRAPLSAPGRNAAEELQGLVQTLTSAGIRLFSYDLTTVDLRQMGLWAIRVLSPDLTSIHCREQWPFLGGRTADLQSRYPGAVANCFPNPQPHPLG